ncbi:MAG: CRISPR-associated endonuclease Cas2 [Alphaproteobacteria bacterium]|nr:MAG: CRISPR-associated endonuclease Cas2 [Alphaproteobacteria bacterium]
MTRKLFLAAYDVSDPRRLADARDAVTGWASGGQRSVFECFVASGRRSQMSAELREPLELSIDRLALLRVRRRGARGLGIADISRDEPVLWIG